MRCEKSENQKGPEMGEKVNSLRGTVNFWGWGVFQFRGWVGGWGASEGEKRNQWVLVKTGLPKFPGSGVQKHPNLTPKTRARTHC